MRVVLEGTQAFRRYRGWGRYCLELLKQFSALENGFQFEVFYHRDGKPDAWFQALLSSPRMRLHPLDLSLEAFTRIEEDRSQSFLEETFPEADVYHSVTEYPFFTPSLPLVVTIHELTPLVMPENHSEEAVAAFGKNLSEVLESATALITVSENTRKDLVAFGRADLPPVFPILNGVSETFTRIEALPSGRSLCFVGPVFDSVKNFSLLAESLSAMEEVTLRIVSNESIDVQVLCRAFPGLARHRLELHRDISDEALAAVYRQSRALVFPSLHEGFGLPIVEAMASGCPVVCGNHSSLREITGGFCRSFDMGSAASLKDALEAELASLGKADRDAAREFVMQRFSWRRAALEYAHVYSTAA